MKLYQPFTAVTQSLRLLYKRRNRDAMPAVLGYSDTPGTRTDIPDMKGFMYARLKGGVPDANGFGTNGSPFPVRSGTAAYPNYPGADIFIAYNYAGELEIVGANNRAMDKAGIDTRSFNPANQQNQWVYLWQIAIAFCSAVANSVNDSFLVTVKKFRHYTGNVFGTFETGTQADKVDLEPYVPATNMHCYAAVWIDLYDNVAEVVASTAQSLFTPLDETDIQECVTNAPGRPPDAVALKLFYLSNDQGSITQQPAKDVDVRQFLNMPAVWGFPTNLTTRERVRPGYTLVTAPYTTSGNGALTVESGGRVVIKPVDNLSATTDPTVNDDSGDGYSIGSCWINTTADTVWFCTDATVGAAVWVNVSSTSGGTVTSVALSEDTDFLEVSGSPVTTAGTLALNRTDGLAANRVVATPDGTTGKVTTRALVDADIPDALTISGGTVNNTPIGTTTPAAGYFSALRLYISGIYANFVHAFTAPRTVTIPGDADIELVGKATMQTLTGKTIDGDDNTVQDLPLSAIKTVGANTKRFITRDASGVITDATSPAFDNANHNHQNAAGGGQLNASNVFSSGQVGLNYGGTAADLSSTGGTGQYLKQTSTGNPVTVGVIPLADLPDLVANQYVVNQGTNYTLSNTTTFTDIDGTNLSFTLSINTGIARVGFAASVNTSAGVLKFVIDVDGSDVAGDDGVQAISTGGAIVVPVVMLWRVTGLSVGSHTFKLQWKTSSGGAGTLYAGAGTTNFDVHPQFFVEEMYYS